MVSIPSSCGGASQIATTCVLDAKLQGKPFWIFDREQHEQQDIHTKGQCCFWHIIGLPQKDGHDMPLLPYQKILYDLLQDHKHIWIKKSRGVGITEFLLRYIDYYCYNRYPTSSVYLIVLF